MCFFLFGFLNLYGFSGTWVPHLEAKVQYWISTSKLDCLGIPAVVFTFLVSMHGQLLLGHFKTYTAGTELSEARGRQLRIMAATGLSEKCSKRTSLSVGTWIIGQCARTFELPLSVRLKIFLFYLPRRAGFLLCFSPLSQGGNFRPPSTLSNCSGFYGSQPAGAPDPNQGQYQVGW